MTPKDQGHRIEPDNFKISPSEKVMVRLDSQDSRDSKGEIDPEKKKKKKLVPFTGTRDDEDRRDRFATLQSKHERSGVTLASSGSAHTIKRIARRYQKEQRIIIF